LPFSLLMAGLCRIKRGTEKHDCTIPRIPWMPCKPVVYPANPEAFVAALFALCHVGHCTLAISSASYGSYRYTVAMFPLPYKNVVKYRTRGKVGAISTWLSIQNVPQGARPFFLVWYSGLGYDFHFINGCVSTCLAH
jgi:hypothetical protein